MRLGGLGPFGAKHICLHRAALSHDRSDETGRGTNDLTFVSILPQAIGKAFNAVAMLQKPADENADVVQEGSEWVGLAINEELLEYPLVVEAEGDFKLHPAALCVGVLVTDGGGYLQPAVGEFLTTHR